MNVYDNECYGAIKCNLLSNVQDIPRKSIEMLSVKMSDNPE